MKTLKERLEALPTPDERVDQLKEVLTTRQMTILLNELNDRYEDESEEYVINHVLEHMKEYEISYGYRGVRERD